MDSNQRKRALRALRRRPEIAALERVARRRRVPAWIVGGALRDRALGRRAPEIDAAVAGDAEAIAADLEREGLGRAVFLSKDRPGPRVFRVAGSRPLDIAEVEGGSIEADLARRDFTANALALGVASGELLDPFGGLTDLGRRRLRCVRPENLAEDPLRILRAARFLASHGLVPDDGVLRASLATAPLFARVAPERVGAELSKLLESPRAAPALAWAARARILSATLGRDLSPSRAAGLARSLEVLDDARTRRLPPATRRRLRLAMIAMRLELPPRETREWLAGRRSGREEGRDVARLVELVAASRRSRTTRQDWGWILEAGALATEALALLERLGPAGARRARRLRSLLRARRKPVAVSGHDVVRWLGLAEGPRVGELLRAVRVASALGEVANRREARHWLTGQVRQGP